MLFALPNVKKELHVIFIGVKFQDLERNIRFKYFMFYIYSQSLTNFH